MCFCGDTLKNSFKRVAGWAWVWNEHGEYAASCPEFIEGLADVKAKGALRSGMPGCFAQCCVVVALYNVAQRDIVRCNTG